MRKMLTLLGLPFAVWACDGLGDRLSGTQVGHVTIVLASASAQGSPSSSLIQFSLDGNVPADAVESIDVTLTRVEARRSDPPEDLGRSPWFEFELAGSGELDLWNDLGGGVAIASGTVPMGTYVDARLRFEVEGTITLTQKVCLGIDGDVDGEGEMCLDPENGPYPLFIPSGSDTGIKTDGSFEVQAQSQTVTLVFDEGATVRTLAWAPGLEAVVMNPVIRAAGEAGE